MNKKLPADQQRRRKELEEARQAGVGPLLVAEEGRGHSTAVPQFITKVPWYVTHQQPQPQPQRQQPTLAGCNTGKQRVVFQASVFRKGACENCGSATHRPRDCLERPRKAGAAATGAGIAADVLLAPPQGKTAAAGFDAKRDRWSGYDAAEEFPATLAAWQEAGQPAGTDEQPQPQQGAVPGQKLDLTASTRITVRNLRMREDTAKYLRNLDPLSAHYDPKTRSMRDCPNAGQPACQLTYLGDDAAKGGGEAAAVKELNLFAWQQQGAPHCHGNPTLAARRLKEAKARQQGGGSLPSAALLEKYGGSEFIKENPFCA